jgi:predicted HTH transcriptional regulator
MEKMMPNLFIHHLATIIPEKARLIQNGITREEYRRRFGMDDASLAYFSRVESDRAFAERMAEFDKPAFKPNTRKDRIMNLLKSDVRMTARMVAASLGMQHTAAADELRKLKEAGFVVTEKLPGDAIVWRRA